jgi:hypothetical protein
MLFSREHSRIRKDTGMIPDGEESWSAVEFWVGEP